LRRRDLSSAVEGRNAIRLTDLGNEYVLLMRVRSQSMTRLRKRDRIARSVVIYLDDAERRCSCRSCRRGIGDVR
jgi:hypothetical protein